MTAKAGRRPKRDTRDIPRPPAAQLVWEKRNELGYTQNYVAEMIGAPQTWMTKYETGRIKFGSPTRMRALARLLHIDYDELVLLSGLVDRYNTAGRFAEQLPSEDVARLTANHARLDPILLRLDPEEFEALVRHAKLLVKISEGRRQAGSPDATPPMIQERMDSRCDVP